MKSDWKIRFFFFEKYSENISLSSNNNCSYFVSWFIFKYIVTIWSNDTISYAHYQQPKVIKRLFYNNSIEISSNSENKPNIVAFDWREFRLRSSVISDIRQILSSSYFLGGIHHRHHTERHVVRADYQSSTVLISFTASRYFKYIFNPFSTNETAQTIAGEQHTFDRLRDF